MRIGTIAELWRYPVKSMGGERLRAAAMSRRGLPGDRGWAVYDETREGITSAKRLPPLRDCSARSITEPMTAEGSPHAEIRFPDGASTSTDAADVAQRLGALVGRPVSLRALGPAGSEAAPRVTSAGEPPEAIRARMGLLPDEPEPDYSAFTPERMRLLTQGNFFDAFSLHLLTRTTLRTLARLAPESSWDGRRFRANVLVEADETDGFPELAWVGRKLRIGDVLLDVEMGCPRCVMVTLAENDLPQDPRIMRTLVREAQHIAGIYLNVLEAGDIREGDVIELLADHA
jgi:uncharacterized protein YcbX